MVNRLTALPTITESSCDRPFVTLPGATLFLVWQQNRSNQAAGVGDFDFGRDFKSLRTTPADNVLAIKLSYWMGM